MGRRRRSRPPLPPRRLPRRLLPACRSPAPGAALRVSAVSRRSRAHCRALARLGAHCPCVCAETRTGSTQAPPAGSGGPRPAAWPGATLGAYTCQRRFACARSLTRRAWPPPSCAVGPLGNFLTQVKLVADEARIGAMVRRPPLLAPPLPTPPPTPFRVLSPAGCTGRKGAPPCSAPASCHILRRPGSPVLICA